MPLSSSSAPETSASLAAKAKTSRPHSSGAARAMRLQRIYARLQEGFSVAEIATAEGLSRERVRQILVAARASRRDEDKPDHARMQIARLAPMLRQAVRAATHGVDGAAKELFAVLDRLDRYLDAGARYREISINELGEGDARINAVTDRDRLLAGRTRALDRLMAAATAHLRAGGSAGPAEEPFDVNLDDEDGEDFALDDEDFDDERERDD